MNRIRMCLTMLLAVLWAFSLARVARADVGGPIPGLSSGAGYSIVAAIFLAAAITSFVLIRRRKKR